MPCTHILGGVHQANGGLIPTLSCIMACLTLIIWDTSLFGEDQDTRDALGPSGRAQRALFLCFSIWNKWINIPPIHAKRKLFSQRPKKARPKRPLTTVLRRQHFWPLPWRTFGVTRLSLLLFQLCLGQMTSCFLCRLVCLRLEISLKWWHLYNAKLVFYLSLYPVYNSPEKIAIFS